MYKKLLTASLFITTAAAIIINPWDKGSEAVAHPQQATPAHVPVQLPTNFSQQSNIEVVFALDTTGSMGGLINAAKEKIWSIASTMASAQNVASIKMGLVAYRDRGDDYVTQVVDLSSDLDSLYAQLMALQASGGGDGPESVNQALYEAVNNISWNTQDNTYKVVFLVGDAPPHMDYQDDVKFPQSLLQAKSRGIIVNTIQCGQESQTRQQWQQIASLGSGDYFQVDQAGSAVAVVTPFDKKIATLAKELDETRLYFGNNTIKEEKRKKVEATRKLHESASVSSQARRAKYNVSKSGKKNLYGDQDLVDAVATGRVELSSIAAQDLPEPLQTLPAVEQQKLIEETAKNRTTLENELRVFADKRDAYIKEEIKKKGGAKDSLDEKIYSAVRRQSVTSGLVYEAERADY